MVNHFVVAPFELQGSELLNRQQQGGKPAEPQKQTSGGAHA